MYDRKFTVEMKSVNHRYGEVNVRLPRILSVFEDKIKTAVSKAALRGKVDVFINYDSYSREDVSVKVNEALADAYVESLKFLKQKYLFDDDITLNLVSRFPDIVSVERNQNYDEIVTQMWETLQNALSQAIGQFLDMRSREGEALKADVLSKNAAIAKLVDEVKTRSPQIHLEYAEKLRQRVSETLQSLSLNTELDEARMLNEVVIFADRSCIDEELTRLQSHISQMTHILSEPDTVGRKLDFLVQEMNREVNTIGSKSNDITITRLIVDLKSEIEKIREQIQNIE